MIKVVHSNVCFKHDFNGSVPVFMLDMIMQMKAKVHSILKLVVLTKCTVLVKLEVLMYFYANNNKNKYYIQ